MIFNILYQFFSNHQIIESKYAERKALGNFIKLRTKTARKERNASRAAKTIYVWLASIVCGP